MDVRELVGVGRLEWWWRVMSYWLRTRLRRREPDDMDLLASEVLDYLAMVEEHRA